MARRRPLPGDTPATGFDQPTENPQREGCANGLILISKRGWGFDWEATVSFKPKSNGTFGVQHVSMTKSPRVPLLATLSRLDVLRILGAHLPRS